MTGAVAAALAVPGTALARKLSTDLFGLLLAAVDLPPGVRPAAPGRAAWPAGSAGGYPGTWPGREFQALARFVPPQPVAAGQATVEVGTETYAVIVREVTGDDRDRVWAKQVSLAPGFSGYEKRTAGIRVIPILELTRR